MLSSTPSSLFSGVLAALLASWVPSSLSAQEVGGLTTLFVDRRDGSHALIGLLTRADGTTRPLVPATPTIADAFAAAHGRRVTLSGTPLGGDTLSVTSL
ncbi:MAG: hypothetical protein MUF00_18785, partial [Gemmatimonadaceae bacterium]|nr:hypothetical protein [Gemmatimonadaceae bacterium]